MMVYDVKVINKDVERWRMESSSKSTLGTRCSHIVPGSLKIMKHRIFSVLHAILIYNRKNNRSPALEYLSFLSFLSFISFLRIFRTIV